MISFFVLQSAAAFDCEPVTGSSLLQHDFKGDASSLSQGVALNSLTCSFDTDFCDWGSGSWSRRTGATPSTDTGPSEAFQGSHYIYTEATSNFNKDFYFTSPTFQAGGTAFYIYFAYSMYGQHMGSLKLESRAGSGSWGKLWERSGDQGPGWHHTLAVIPATATDLRFHGRTGSNYMSDVALDDLVITAVPPPVGAYSLAVLGSLTCDFEHDDFCGWANSASKDWRVHSGSTGSYKTGPSGAYQGSRYAYTEASGQNNPDKIFMLVSPAFNQDRAVSVSFKYHMYGANMGTLELQSKNGAQWVTRWTKSGNQGDSWWSATVSVPASATQLRFQGTTGSSYTSDMCIDDIRVT